jgi:ubiquinone/menaquinone biosynthesis C-methylase UbiE
MDRIQKEKNFHNKRFEEETRDQLNKYYSIAHLIDKYYNNKLNKACNGKTVLEYGCGLGNYSAKLSELAAKVHAIDISEVAVLKARETAQNNSLRNIRFHVMNAEELNFPDNYFDVVCGTAILHHLKLNLAYSELARVLNKNGKIFFIEPLGHNPLICLFRKLTSQFRTEDEHPLLIRDINLLDQYFNNKEIKYFFLLSILAVPFREKKYFSKISNFLNSIDQKLFKLPFFKHQAWMVVISGSNPKK